MRIVGCEDCGLWGSFHPEQTPGFVYVHAHIDVYFTPGPMWWPQIVQKVPSRTCWGLYELCFLLLWPCAREKKVKVNEVYLGSIMEKKHGSNWSVAYSSCSITCYNPRRQRKRHSFWCSSGCVFCPFYLDKYFCGMVLPTFWVSPLIVVNTVREWVLSL